MPCGPLGSDADLNIMLLWPGFHWQTQSHRYREFVVIPCPCSRVFFFNRISLFKNHHTRDNKSLKKSNLPVLLLMFVTITLIIIRKDFTAQFAIVAETN